MFTPRRVLGAWKRDVNGIVTTCPISVASYIVQELQTLIAGYPQLANRTLWTGVIALLGDVSGLINMSQGGRELRAGQGGIAVQQLSRTVPSKRVEFGLSGISSDNGGDPGLRRHICFPCLLHWLSVKYKGERRRFWKV